VVICFFPTWQNTEISLIPNDLRFIFTCSLFLALPILLHISRHAFAHIAQESGAESSAIKNILGHSNLATTERYMGSFDTSKTDNTLRSLFTKKKTGTDGLTDEEREQQAIELLKGMSPQQIMSIISAINK